MGSFPEIIAGGTAIDDRGVLSYLNSAPFEKVKRMYMVDNFDAATIRAFHGHRLEEKLVLVVAGAAIVNVSQMRIVSGNIVGLDQPTRFVLADHNPQLLRIPAGYANGWKALLPNTKILFFSSTTMEEAKHDDYRWPWHYFAPSVWEVEHR